MIQFTSLRLNGFKSFVDRTELEIAPGLNGIVGPNGCGKSNLVEALKWVMGENSAKRMRGDGMEDVIFAGSSGRAPRNIAEVSLLLDNSARTAPAQYNQSDDIEVIRRIEKDHGSTYKVNGKTVRARDVQMLFADTVTGASSPALVSQGQITKIINSKPLERRLILEESAGISGLYARRHEAELRLKAADSNLLRIEDIVGSMEGRLSDLKRQARQASRYSNINAQIRQLEIIIHNLEWRAINEKHEAGKVTLTQTESVVAERLATVTQLTKTQTTQSQEIPPLREKEASLSAKLQSQKITLQRMEDEQERTKLQIEETQETLKQIDVDFQHEKQTLKDNAEQLERIQKEQDRLLGEQDNHDDTLQEKEKIKDELEEKVSELEAQYTALMESAAESRAKIQAIEDQMQKSQDRLDAIITRKTRAEEELAALSNNKEKIDNKNKLEKEVKELEQKYKALHEETDDKQNQAQSAQTSLDAARAGLNAIDTKRSELLTEINMLKSLCVEDDKEFESVLESIQTQSGFERALSRVLGDSLLASLNAQAPSYWVKTGSANTPQKLPKGASPLLPHVEAPQELHLALSQIGYVENDAKGQDLMGELQPGQALVSAQGTYWRWDGFIIKGEAADRHSIFLEQKNKLQELENKKPTIEKEYTEANTKLQNAINAQKQAQSAQEETQKTLKDLSESLTQKRQNLEELRQDSAKAISDMAVAQETVTLASEDIVDIEKTIKSYTIQLKAYQEKEDDKQTEQTENIKETLQETREAYQSAMRTFDLLQQEHNSRKARLRAIGDERINLKNKTIRGKERIKEFEDRKVTQNKKLQELKDRPNNFEKEKGELLDLISNTQKQRDDAAEKLSVCESGILETNKALKEAEQALGEMREQRAGLLATIEGLNEQKETMKSAIQEHFGMEPEELESHINVNVSSQNTEISELEGLRGKKEKITRERDMMGPVNLQADAQAQELEKELSELLNERNDLMQAIEELREGINKINKEARERLLAAFEHVNAHFSDLFIRLFGGGKAHLALIDSDDPLGAGLEIFAQPPGKSLQSLSLLSGGEQTLASIALIFAMFLTNPSPICVLDEIDAPLDDANVDRVCDLLDEIAERGETRFLIITHHRLTMARMDRLYGVTMAEKGVSQLVSVDLQQSFDFLEAA